MISKIVYNMTYNNNYRWNVLTNSYLFNTVFVFPTGLKNVEKNDYELEYYVNVYKIRIGQVWVNIIT